jgi:outer membrane protein OmpA-like peptidoglycan-associated protein/uncharacterized protein YidB (DUF937 family)
MFEQLVSEAASRFNVSPTSVTALLRGLFALVTNESTGGLTGFLDQFRRAGLGDAISSWLGGKDVRPLTAPQLESALGDATVDRLAVSSGLARAAAAPVLAYLVPKVIGFLTPNGVVPSTAALRSQLAGLLDRPAPAIDRHADAPRAAPPVIAERKGLPAWIPWASAALIALVGFLWLRGPSGTINPQLTVSNRDGKVSYSGIVRDEGTRSAIVTALNTTFGAPNVTGDLRVDPNVRPAPWLARLGDLFGSARAPGVDLTLDGDAVKLGGWLSATDRQAITDRLRDSLGANTPIGTMGDPAVDSMRAANDKAVTALKALGTSGVAPDAVVHALNLAIINFPTGSAEIPADSRPVLLAAATSMKAMPAGSMIEIGGHTDNTGEASANVVLSQQRADAVKTALVSDGVSASMLTTKGYGSSRPRATNESDYGRFQNRRIEYVVVR